MQATEVSTGFTQTDTVQLRLELGTIDKGVLTDAIPAGYRALADAQDNDGWVWDAGGYQGRVIGDSWMPVAQVTDSPLTPLFEAPDGTGGARQAAIDDLARWTVLVNGSPVAIDEFSRKSHISDSANIGNTAPDFATIQNLFFDLPGALTPGDVVTLRFDDPAWQDIAVTYAPGSTLSEAIHVNLTGFDPDDPVKVAYLSSWNGWRVDPTLADNGTGVAEVYDGPRDFWVRDADTGQTVFTGTTELSKGAGEATNFWLNYAQADVWKMDFSDLSTPGDYVVVVDGIGISPTFSIDAAQWSDIFSTVFQGFYHQRSGVELTADATDWTHPRSLHPDDGKVVVYASNVGIDDTNNGYKDGAQDKFEALIANATDEILPDAWGGYHDAGDWDRRTQHIEASRKLMELHELAPEWSESVTARLPDAETGNAIPDLLDEAIFGMEFFARMQTDDGGVRGGIEGASYRSYGAASWDEAQVLYAYAPDIWTSWEFASGAARLARLLTPYDPAAAEQWLDRALAAMTWAEDRADTRDTDDFVALMSRNIAALDLYAATGDSAWHDLFQQTWVHDGRVEVPWNGVQYEAAALYHRLDPSLTEASVLAQAQGLLIDRAEFLLSEGSRSPFGGLHDPYAPYGWGNTHQEPTNSAKVMIAAYEITGDQRYFDAVVDDLQYTLGANPLNMSYLTGIDGVRSPQNLLNADADAMGGKIPDGILLYGDYNIHDYGQDWFYDYMWNDLFPDPWRTPVFESYQGFFGFVPSTEYTVQQGISDLTFVTGWLAAENHDAGDTGWSVGAPQSHQRPGGLLRQEGDSGADQLDGSSGNDFLRGQSGDDLLRGFGSDDMLFGDLGNDVAKGGGGSDLARGGAGNDRLYGQPGRDFLYGNDGDDLLAGGADADVLFGARGADRLLGGDGNDWLSGGKDDDLYRGGAGADTFALARHGGVDRVIDYQQGIDHIALDPRLWRSDKTAEEVVADHASLTGPRITLTFDDGTRLYLAGENLELALLAGDLMLTEQ